MVSSAILTRETTFCDFLSFFTKEINYVIAAIFTREITYVISATFTRR